MIDIIQEKIDKYAALRSVEDVYLSQDASVTQFKLICGFLSDLNELLESAKEKKKACCEKKAGKQITVTACRNCPYMMSCAILPDYCDHPKGKKIGGRAIKRHDIIPDWCPIC